MNRYRVEITLYPFSRGGGRQTLPPRLCIDSDPPAFTGLKYIDRIFKIKNKNEKSD